MDAAEDAVEGIADGASEAGEEGAARGRQRIELGEQFFHFALDSVRHVFLGVTLGRGRSPHFIAPRRPPSSSGERGAAFVLCPERGSASARAQRPRYWHSTGRCP